MKELNSTEQEGLSISAYWPPKSPDELPIGYGGVSNRFIALQCVGFLLALSNRFVKLPVGSRFISVNVLLQLGLMLIIILLLLLPGRQQEKKRGFYQLDGYGTPTHYIGRFTPQKIGVRVGLSRKRFLQSLLG